MTLRKPKNPNAGSGSSAGTLLQLLALLTLVALVATGCAQGNGVASTGPAAPDLEVDAKEEKVDEAIPVAVLPLGRGAIESVLRYSTNLEAESSVGVYSQASHRVTRLLVEEGDRVRQGQLLLSLQDEMQKTALERTQSQLERARREYERQNRLFGQELISEQAFNDARYEMEQLELALEDAERELGYASVRSPIAGIVTQRLVSLGDHVNANDHLFDIVDFDSIVARVFVPESELTRLAVGQEARVTSQALGGEPKEARIDRISPVVDPRSGTVKITLEIPRNQGLAPGMYVEVDLVAETRDDALLVPKRALVYDQDQVYVFRIADPAAEEPTVEKLLVQLAVQSRDFVEVLGGDAGSGLDEGDQLVVAGQAGLKSGAKVRLLDAREALATLADLEGIATGG